MSLIRPEQSSRVLSSLGNMDAAVVGEIPDTQPWEGEPVEITEESGCDKKDEGAEKIIHIKGTLGDVLWY